MSIPSGKQGSTIFLQQPFLKKSQLQQSPGDKAIADTSNPPKVTFSKTSSVAGSSAQTSCQYYGHRAWTHQPSKKEFSLFIKRCHSLVRARLSCEQSCCLTLLYSPVASDERCHLASVQHRRPRLGQPPPQLNIPIYSCRTSQATRSPLPVVGRRRTC